MTTTAITPEEREELKAKALKATPGPWNDSGHSVDDFDADCCMRMEWIPNGAADDDDDLNANSKADGAFIAAANPSVVLSLLASLEEAEGRTRDDHQALLDADEAFQAMKARAEKAEQHASWAKEGLRHIAEDYAAPLDGTDAGLMMASAVRTLAALSPEVVGHD